jgi:hypothetical protein
MKKSRLYELDGPIRESITKIRLDFDEDEVSPQHIRGLLGRIGRVGDVSIYSVQTCTYALVDMVDRDARQAVGRLQLSRWRGAQVCPIFAVDARTRTWSPHHNWKPPVEIQDDEDEES